MSLSNHPKIAVAGAGAVGSLIGGLLAEKGEDVTLIARKKHAEAIRKNKLLISGRDGDIHVGVKAAETLEFNPEVVLLAVKSQDVEEACREIAGDAGDATIVTLQNGVRSDDIVAGYFKKDHIVSGIVMFNAQYLEPGKVSYAHPGEIIVGNPFGESNGRANVIAELLNRAVRTTVNPNIHGVRWSKLLVNNLSNGVEAMTGMTISDCMRDPVLKKISLMTLREGFRVIRKAGYNPASLPGVPLTLIKFLAKAPVPVAGWMLGNAMKKLKTMSSTLQSIQRGRPTEIEYLNGEIVRLGERIDMATPVNRMVLEAVGEVERNGKFFTADDLPFIEGHDHATT